MKNTIMLIALAAVLAVAGYISWWVYHLHHSAEMISHISLGDSKAKVLKIVGKPDVVNTPPNHLWCSNPETSYEYMYGTTLLASWDVIGFNKDDKVVCKKELESP